jgi:zinc transport system substrate-binding protein
VEKRRILIVSLLFTGILVAVSLIYFAASIQENPNDGKIGVVVSVAPEAEFVNAVGGDKVNVTVMVPPGANPHTYEPLPEQLKDVGRAKIYVEVGTPIEFELNYMDKLKNSNPNMLVVNSSTGVNLIPNTAENEEGADPHIWVSPKNAKIMVENIYQGLVQVDPANKDYYRKNRDNYLHQLDEIDENITRSLKGKENSSILVYHPAWAYFCKDYHLKQISIESGGKEPTPREIANIVDFARKNNIKVVFVEPQYNPGSAEVIASEIGGQVVTVDDLSEKYIENLKNVEEAFENL